MLYWPSLMMFKRSHDLPLFYMSLTGLRFFHVLSIGLLDLRGKVVACDPTYLVVACDPTYLFG